ncbi:MAG: sulfatase-like hydrolase/transferase, partial [Cyanothece sp. SIO1E1]|nr:sulfatase-like hydrolase/transferase [Cyanothece sp. SIO1E1]
MEKKIQRHLVVSRPVYLGLFLFIVLVRQLIGNQDSRPNFVFIYTDDQRYDCLGVVQREQGPLGRFPWFDTPNMDRLANEGIRFSNAFVVHSLCTPSRASFLTGQYTHSHGIFTNFISFPENMINFGSELGKAGYETAYIGKWHMGRQGGRRPGFKYSASYKEQGQYFDCPFEVDGKETQTSGWVDDVSTDFAIAYLKQSRSQ